MLAEALATAAQKALAKTQRLQIEFVIPKAASRSFVLGARNGLTADATGSKL